MPRVIFDSIPEKLTGADFVKVTEYLYLYHWDESLCLYRCPHTKLFALVPYAMYSRLYQNAWSVRNNSEAYGIKAWYKTKALAVRDNYAYLYERMLKGQPYALLKMQDSDTTIRIADNTHAMV